MQSDLKALLELQEKDRAIMEIEAELAALEPEIRQLDDQVAALEAAVAEAETGLERANGRREELETRIETYKVMQERRRKKLEWVRGAKEASALMAEIDLARGVLAKEEAEWVRSADEVQEIKQLHAAAQEQVEAERESQVEARAAIATKTADCEKRMTAARADRDEAAKKVARPMLAIYDRIRRGRAPLAMYEVHGDACGHCFTSVPMHLRQQIQRGKAVATCEACGVIMFVNS